MAMKLAANAAFVVSIISGMHVGLAIAAGDVSAFALADSADIVVPADDTALDLIVDGDIGDAAAPANIQLPKHDTTLEATTPLKAPNSMQRGVFLGFRNEVDTSALMARVQKVEALAASERVASQAQQEALTALLQEQKHLASRLESLSAAESSRKRDPYLCSPRTEATCLVYKCDADPGTVCESGACVCKPGLCADGHGRCRSSQPARKLPGFYKIEVKESPGDYLYMDVGALTQEVRVQRGDPGKQGHWRVVVNNDNSVMLHTEAYGPDHFLSIEDMQSTLDNKNDPVWRASYSSLSSLVGTDHLVGSFEIYNDTQNNVYLKNIRRDKWLEAQGIEGWITFLKSNKVEGTSYFPGRKGALTFVPPLDGVTMLPRRASAPVIHLFFPLMLIIVANLAR